MYVRKKNATCHVLSTSGALSFNVRNVQTKACVIVLFIFHFLTLNVSQWQFQTLVVGRSSIQEKEKEENANRFVQLFCEII